MFETINNMLGYLQDVPEVLAVLLMGSASLGVQDERSDIDLLVIYDGASKPQLHLPTASWKWDVGFETLEEFKIGHRGHWSAHSFLTAKLLFDKTNEVTHEIRRIVEVPSEERVSRTESFLDAYLNAFYRSMKSARRNNRLGATLHAGDSVRILVACLFVMNGLIPPYQDRIQTSLYELEAFPLSPKELYERFITVAWSAEPLSQSELFRVVEAFLRNRGFGHVYDSWGDMLNDELINYDE